MKNRIIILIICLLAICSLCGASNVVQQPGLVMLTHTNLSNYKDQFMGFYIDEAMLSKIVDSEIFCVYEKVPVKETIQIEEDLIVSNEEFSALLEQGDFHNTFNSIHNNLTDKKKGEYVSKKTTHKLAEKYRVEYFMHCTLDKIAVVGSGFSAAQGGVSLLMLQEALSINVSDLKLLKQSLEFVATFRLIRAVDGMVVWMNKENTNSNNFKINFKGFNYNDKSSRNQLYVECATKLSERAFKNLRNALKKGEVVLQ